MQAALFPFPFHKKILLSLLAGGLFIGETTAQVNPIDSIRTALIRGGSFAIGLDGRNSFIAGSPARVMGFRVGMDCGTVRLYTGLYSLGKPVPGQGYTLPGDTVSSKLNFSYWGQTVDWRLYEDERWELALPVQAGIGIAYRERFRNGISEQRKRPFFIPVEVQFTAIYKLTRYFGLSAGLGFRVSSLKGSSFNGPVYYYGISFFGGTLYRDLKNKGWNLP
jgi:hypothetical protein